MTHLPSDFDAWRTTSPDDGAALEDDTLRQFRNLYRLAEQLEREIMAMQDNLPPNDNLQEALELMRDEVGPKISVAWADHEDSFKDA